MNKLDALIAAIDACYDAVVEPQAWQSALDQMAQAMNARASSIHARSSVHLRNRFPASPVYREFLTEFIADGWALRDPRAKRGWVLVEQGKQVVVDRDIVTDQERRTLAEYTYLYPKYDLPEWSGVASQVNGDYWVMSFLRGRSQGEFVADDVRLLAQIAPHLARIIKLSGYQFEQTVRQSFDLLEGMSVAAMQVNRNGKIELVNSHARALLGRDVDITDGKLCMLDPEGSAKFQAAIDQAIKIRAASQFTAVEPIVIQRLHKRPLLVDVFPCVGSLHDVFCQSSAIVVLTDLADLTDQKIASELRLRVAFGLTPAETRLAVLIGSGVEITVASEHLRIGKETVRSQLKSLFSKTQTRRQAELVLVLVAAMRINRR